MAVPIRLPAGYTLAAVAQTLLLLCTVCCALTDYDSKFSAAGFQQYVGNTTINVDLTKTHPVSDKLYGIFFEEIGHAGEGGLYAELIQDRSFEGLAFTKRFQDSSAKTMPITGDLLIPTPPTVPRPKAASLSDMRAEFARMQSTPERLSLQPKAWFPNANTSASLTKLHPLNSANVITLNISTHAAVGGIINTGYWGIPVQKGKSYFFSAHFADPFAEFKNESLVRVALESSSGNETYASATVGSLKPHWNKFTANLTSSVTDDKAQLRLSFKGPGTLLVDVVSLFPADHIVEGLVNPYPFRKDLLQMLKDLKPRFLRVPGGCVVEGNILKEAFNWEASLGPMENRPGHWDLWGYWNTDGMGMFEYLLLAEELETEPVWVANNGVAHWESVNPNSLRPWIDSALASLEFAMGSVWTPHGALRQEMGHPKPWNISYFAIGNEDCGHAWYVENYRAFFSAIRTEYPWIQLISNCNLGNGVPQDLFDWHIYTSAWDLIKRQHEFDNMVPGQDPRVFASEYATTEDGGWGNLKGALAEATFMTGMERNSEAVYMASYAPLFTNTNDHWWQTNLIMFNGTRVYGIPSYYVQKLFSHAQGVSYAPSTATSDHSLVHNELVAASATCQDHNCTHLALKVVNNGGFRQLANVTLTGISAGRLSSNATAQVLTGDFPEIENNLEMPQNVYPEEYTLRLRPIGDNASDTAAFTFWLPGNSLVVLHLKIDWSSGPSPSIVSRSVVPLTTV